ncbi:hypothetical protein J437_LFUL001197 [Ladona fulva]|uniref:Sodium-independent sulfate anion transporter n=1 Tax=Ladona fulva TaxID=123851 RepID=A0A8K0JWV1_LADFU|nr:hypothetical protein J437_LFUL001197 [Ladona fulva]
MVTAARWSLRRESDAARSAGQRCVSCTKNFIRRRFPPLKWGPTYDSHKAASDAVAGITIGLTLIPQAIAYAGLAGLSAQYGLYSSFAGSFVYILLGTCPEVNIGPSALLSLLTFNYTHDTSPEMAVLLCFLAGIIELLCGIFHLGFLVEFVSLPVISGFTSAAALIIACAQIKGLLGLKYKAEGFKEIWVQVYHHVGEARTWDIVLSVCCVTTLLLIRMLKDFKVKEDTPRGRTLNKFFWFFANARNALVVVVCAFIAFIFKSKGETPFVLTGEIDVGLPAVGPPPFSTSFGNSTYGFMDMCRYLGSGVFVTPIIGILGNVAIAKAFANGKVVDATQEMIALGFCNIIGSFFRSMPVNGSFSRSAVSNASGVLTPFAGVYTGVMVILALTFLTPYFYYIPKATLASVIICAVIFMVDIGKVKPMWKSNKRDLVPAFITFFACLLIGVEYGLLVGVAVDVAFVMYGSARPEIVVEKITDIPGVPPYLKVTPDSGLMFPAIDYLREVVSCTRADEKLSNMPLVVDCVQVHRADFTVMHGIESLIKDFKKCGQHIVFHRLTPSVRRVLDTITIPEFITSSSDSDLHHILRGFTLEDRIPTDTKLEMEMSKRSSSVSIKDSGV